MAGDDGEDESPAGLQLRPVGVIRSDIKARRRPQTGIEGAPDVWLDVHPWGHRGTPRVLPGDELIVITWFHRARRDVFQVHPRSEKRNPLTGVFATRSRIARTRWACIVAVRAIDGNRLRVGPIEAIDGTPVVDIKPVLPCEPRGAEHRHVRGYSHDSSFSSMTRSSSRS
jgi:tRNA (Thr-GGU) A37 N-methylase